LPDFRPKFLKSTIKSLTKELKTYPFKPFKMQGLGLLKQNKKSSFQAKPLSVIDHAYTCGLFSHKGQAWNKEEINKQNKNYHCQYGYLWPNLVMKFKATINCCMASKEKGKLQ
jgi:hypothetical protein